MGLWKILQHSQKKKKKRVCVCDIFLGFERERERVGEWVRTEGEI